MNKALRFRRRLAWTWLAVAVVLLTAFYLAVRGAGEAVAQERSVAHTQEVAAVQANALPARIVALFAAGFALLILGFAGYFVQREIISRGRIESGLRKAQELLGVELEGQRAELGHTMEDLHAQIEARRAVEREVRLLKEELEERLEQRTRELKEANGELEAFTYSVSHDLRAPLRHMDGFSRILQQEYGAQLPEEARHYLDRVRSATTHMSRLVEDLLQLSRVGRQVPKRRTVALNDLLEQARAEVLEAATDHRPIDWDIGDLPEAEVDSSLFLQVWINLLSNAIKFSRNQERPMIQIGSRPEKSETTIFVRDNGVGFDPRFADKLFGVFQRLHRQDEFEGTGIGLATVQRIVHKHGGRIWAESQPGHGATFYFTVSVHKSNTRPPKAAIGALA